MCVCHEASFNTLFTEAQFWGRGTRFGTSLCRPKVKGCVCEETKTGSQTYKWVVMGFRPGDNVTLLPPLPSNLPLSKVREARRAELFSELALVIAVEEFNFLKIYFQRVIDAVCDLNPSDHTCE